MTDKELTPEQKSLYEELINREVESIEVFLAAKARRAAISLEEYVATQLIHGVSREAIRQGLLDDLEEGGRIFGEFRNAIRATSNGMINRVRDNSIFSVVGVKTKYRWVAVLVNTCPDCLDRHGKVKEWDKWEEDGLPRTGQTVCKENCKCVLLPATTTELEPIMRNKN